MNSKLRSEIIEQALKQGVSHTQGVIDGNTVDDYSGSAMVNINGKKYKVSGRAAKYHAMAYTNGYCSIQQKTAKTGLR